MKRSFLPILPLALLPLALLSLALLGAMPFPPGFPIVSEAEVFPVAPAVDDQRGFAVAIDGEWLALGARLEDVDGNKDAGAVHLFHLEEGSWKHKERLLSSDLPQHETPQANGQFGLAVALRGGTLAVGAPGENRVHVFVLQGNHWSWRTKLEAGIDQFGRAVSIDGDWLAVGGGDPHGQSSNAVRIYRQTGMTWNETQTLLGGELFGHAVSLRGATLVVGAPGMDGAKGAAYVYTRTNETWSQSALLKDPDAAEGDQFGFAVATNGQDVVVGAPTRGTDNAGAAWVWRLGDGLTRLPGGEETGAQLGYAVAIDGERIAIGAPFGGEKLFGFVSILERVDGAWSAGEPFGAESAEARDLAGFAVAVSGEWVLLGTVLGDQGGQAAGSVSSIRCRLVCQAWSEVAVPGGAKNETFGISVAADGDVFAVGARGKDLIAPQGSVTVFRRAVQGWRQEIRLTSAGDHTDEFGAAVAIHRDPDAGDLLVVGDPKGAFVVPGGDPGSLVGGGVYLFRREDRVWKAEARFSSPSPAPADRFGLSVATDGRTIVVGAGGPTGASYVFERQTGGGWSEGLLVVPEDLAGGGAFGAVVAVVGDTIAVGAPSAHGHDGEVHVFERGNAWEWQTKLVGGFKEELGSAVSLSTFPDPLKPGEEKTVLAVGAPRRNGFSGEAYVFEGSGGSWASLPLFHAPGAKQAFGSAVAVHGRRLVVGAPVVGQLFFDIDQAYFYERNAVQWQGLVIVDAISRVLTPEGERPPAGDNFGSAVAIGKDFFVVTSPGKQGSDRVAVFELPKEVTP